MEWMIDHFGQATTAGILSFLISFFVFGLLSLTPMFDFIHVIFSNIACGIGTLIGNLLGHTITMMGEWLWKVLNQDHIK